MLRRLSVMEPERHDILLRDCALASCGKHCELSPPLTPRNRGGLCRFSEVHVHGLKGCLLPPHLVYRYIVGCVPRTVSNIQYLQCDIVGYEFVVVVTSKNPPPVVYNHDISLVTFA